MHKNYIGMVATCDSEHQTFDGMGLVVDMTTDGGLVCLESWDIAIDDREWYPTGHFDYHTVEDFAKIRDDANAYNIWAINAKAKRNRAVDSHTMELAFGRLAYSNLAARAIRLAQSHTATFYDGVISQGPAARIKSAKRSNRAVDLLGIFIMRG